MSNKTLGAWCLTFSLLTLAGCAPVQAPEDEAPPPPQNLIGSTDELQLVTELASELATTYGGDRVLVVLEIDNTLLTAEQDSTCPQGAMRPTKADVAKQVRHMQDAGLKVIVLTSRGPECRSQTLGQLQDNGFSFQASAWPPEGGYPVPFIPSG